MIKLIASEIGIHLTPAGGTTFLINQSDCEKIIEELGERGLPIIGIEGFRVKGRELFPDLDIIADFSSLRSLSLRERVEVSNREAKKFVNMYSDTAVLFDIAVDH